MNAVATEARRTLTKPVLGALAVLLVGLAIHPFAGAALALLLAWRLGYRKLFIGLAALLLVWFAAFAISPWQVGTTHSQRGGTPVSR